MNENSMLLVLVFGPMVAAVISYLIGLKSRKVRDVFVIVITGLIFAGMSYLSGNYLTGDGISYAISIPKVCGLGINFVFDGFRAVYGWIAAFMWFMTALLSKEYFGHYHTENRYFFFFLLTLGATLGVFLSADLYTTFIFFEIMSFTSYTWVAQEEKPAALRAAETYLAVAVIGGLVMLMGIFILYHELGTLTISELFMAAEMFENKKLVYVASLCMLFGFGAKAGAFPLHIWLPKAHPVAPAPASALLSGILTKSGIYGALIISCDIFYHNAVWGTLMLTIGVITMVVGAVLALFSIDLKRTLACSSVSQIGFILIGVGMMGLLGEENGLAMRGTILHMVNHSLFKLLLFMCAGVVFMNLHKLDLNEIRGFGRKKPVLMLCFLSGALGIGGIPFFNGYVSKTLLHESIVEYQEVLHEGHVVPFLYGHGAMTAIEWIFLVSGGLTVAYMTKLFICVFVEKNQDEALQKKYDGMKQYMTLISAIAIIIPAVLFPIMGSLPWKVMDTVALSALPFMNPVGEFHEVEYFGFESIKGGLTSIAIGACIYLLIARPLLMKKEGERRVYVNRWPKFLDLEDVVYRPLLLNVLPTVCGFFMRILDSLVDGFVVLLRKTIYKDMPLPYEIEEGDVVTENLGAMVQWHYDRKKKAKETDEETAKETLPEKDYRRIFAMKRVSIKENISLITRSMSFGLMLFCIGLIITLVYLLFFT